MIDEIRRAQKARNHVEQALREITGTAVLEMLYGHDLKKLESSLTEFLVNRRRQAREESSK